VPVNVESTPNPNAMKFSVGRDVGGPATFTEADGADDTVVQAVFAAAPGAVQQVFKTAQFYSVTKTADADWDEILPAIRDAVDTALAD
jgi:hypothetical protein